MAVRGNLAKRKHYFTDYDGVLDDKSVTEGKLSDGVLAKFEELHNAKISISQKGVPNGVAELDENGFVPSAQLPSYVDDTIEGTLATFPNPGESGKIYVDTDTNLTYRWSGSQYTEISKSIGLGETSSTAYPGNKGRQNADNIALLQENVSDLLADTENILKDTGVLSTLTTTDKTSIVNAINEIQTETNEAQLKAERLQYYGDANIVPTDTSYFIFTKSSKTTASITGLTDDGKALTNVVVPYKCTIDSTEYIIDDFDIGQDDNGYGVFEAGSKVETVVIPNSFTSIRHQAFYCCDTLKKVILPNTITSIEDVAFAYCTNLTDINISDSITSIDGFYGCTSLTSIYIPNSVTTIADSAFSGCENLTIICNQGSYAETYAILNGIPYEYNNNNIYIGKTFVFTSTDDFDAIDETYIRYSSQDHNIQLGDRIVLFEGMGFVSVYVCTGITMFSGFFNTGYFSRMADRSAILELNETITDNSNNITNLQTQVGNLNDLETSNDTLVGAINDVSYSLNNLGVEVGVNATYINDLQTRVGYIETDMTKALDSRIDDNKTDIEALQTQIGDIETILADIQADQEALINGGEE